MRADATSTAFLLAEDGTEKLLSAVTDFTAVVNNLMDSTERS